jgi:hypothetical protein
LDPTLERSACPTSKALQRPVFRARPLQPSVASVVITSSTSRTRNMSTLRSLGRSVGATEGPPALSARESGHGGARGFVLADKHCARVPTASPEVGRTFEDHGRVENVLPLLLLIGLRGSARTRLPPTSRGTHRYTSVKRRPGDVVWLRAGAYSSPCSFFSWQVMQ